MPFFRRVLCCALLACGCTCQPSTVPDPPNSNDELTKQSIQQSTDSARQINHLIRLREFDRLRHAEEVGDLTSRIDTLRGLCITLSFAVAACCLWLAIEIRRRRILSAAIHHLALKESSQHPTVGA